VVVDTLQVDGKGHVDHDHMLATIGEEYGEMEQPYGAQGKGIC
jgi:hypothetical protein